MALDSNTQTIEIPLPEPIREMVEEAARLRGQTVAEFVAAALEEKASEVLQSGPVRRLTERDAIRFLEMLDTHEPNEALRAAARRYREEHG